MGSFVTQPDPELLVVNIGAKPIDFAEAIAGKQFCRLHVYGKPANFHLLSTLTHLVELRMQSTRLTDLSALAGFTRLESLTYTTGSLKEIDLSFAAKTLTSLWLSSHRSLTDLEGIAACKKLKSLTLNNLSQVAKHIALKTFKDLEVLSLRSVRRWPTLRGVEKAVRLKSLYLDQTTVLDGDWKPLLKLRELTFLSGAADAFGKPAALELAGRRPEVRMIRRFPG